MNEEQAALTGKRIAIAGPRKAEEMSSLVAKHGGIPLIRPAQGTTTEGENLVSVNWEHVLELPVDWFIFTTGAGFEALLQHARTNGRETAFLHQLKMAHIGARGYKAVAALRQMGLKPDARDDDGTTAGLIRSLSSHPLDGKRVVLQLHGDPAPHLVRFLREAGSSVLELMPYRHIPPAAADLDLLVQEIVRGELDAVLFTSGAQVRFLLEHAASTGQYPKLQQAFAHTTIAAAVGKYTAEYLREVGISRVIVPEIERMAHLIEKLATYYKEAVTPAP